MLGQFLLGQLVSVLDFNFYSTEPLGQKVVNCCENDKEDEAENAHDEGHQKVNDSYDLELLVTEDNHGNPDECVDEAHQDIERGQYLAGLENGDSNQLLFHGLWLVTSACISVIKENPAGKMS